MHVPGQPISSINKEHNSLNVIQDALVPAVSGSLYDRLHETRHCSILDNTVEMSYLLDKEAPRSNRQLLSTLSSHYLALSLPTDSSSPFPPVNSRRSVQAF